MILACNICRRAYDVEDDPHLFDVPEWQASFPCVAPLCSGRLFQVEAADNPLKCSKHVFFKALHRMGNADGSPAASMDRVKSKLFSSRVVDVCGVQNGDRVIVESLVLDDGSKLHLSPSVHGACIHYLEERSG